MPSPGGLSAEQPATAMRCHACGLDLLTAYNQAIDGHQVIPADSAICRIQEINDAFTKLAIHGIPRETATTISTGIDMLVKKHNSEAGLTKYKEAIWPLLKETVDLLKREYTRGINPKRQADYIHLIYFIEKILAEPN